MSRSAGSAWLAQRRAELALIPLLLRRVGPAIIMAKRSRTAPFIAWLEGHAARSPHAVFCEQDEQRLTFAELRRNARRTARVLVDAGLAPGEVVALIGGNGPRYLQNLFAVGYAGGVTALVNPELRREPLRHAVALVQPRLTLVESAVRSAISELESPVTGRMLGYDGGELDELERSAVELEAPRADPKGDFVFIFTSGTTGLPKACRVSHDRARSAATIFGSVAFDFRRGDKLYCALPLHHSSALLLGVGAALVAGVPIALRRKFSAQNFVPDLVRYGATATLYVGDVGRAVVHAPASDVERRLRLRVAVGNGLAPEIWAAFRSRLGGPQVREFYASTEAPSAILNLTQKVGSLGHVPFERRRGFRLAKLDAEREQLVRDENGYVEECASNEPGELLLRVRPSAGRPYGEFRGYEDERASSARIVYDVFERGDAYFRSGDILRRDSDGYFYFVDRRGDGFRWKGENVSALEVERTLGAKLGFDAVAVVGVSVPSYPGRAGFAQIVVDPGDEFDPARFAEAASELPSHARPCFVEPVPALALTSTLKIKRRGLDFDALAKSGVLWVRRAVPGEKDRYVVLTEDLWNDLVRGQARL